MLQQNPNALQANQTDCHNTVCDSPFLLDRITLPFYRHCDRLPAPGNLIRIRFKATRA